MWTNNRSVSTVPDMNPEHYYRIPQGTFNTTEDIFIKIRDYGKYSSWITLSTDSSWWGNLYNAHGLSGSHGNLEIYNWNPWDNLYKYENGEYIHLPMNATKTFESPVGNTDGSFDRMMVQMESALNLTKLTLEADPNNTVAVTTFAGSVVSDVNFTNDLSIIETVLANHDGHDNTRWGDGLNQALTNLNARVDTNKTSYVIFITDGLPTDGNNGLNKANQIKNETNAIIYSIGIQSNALDKLTPLATSPEHAYDAVDSTDFINYIDKITKDIIMQPKGTLVEVISDQFDFYIDATHPFVIGDEVYTTFESIPDNLLDKQTFTLNMEQIDSEGKRINFYTKAKEELVFGNYDKVTEIKTNAEANLTYNKIIKDPNTGILSYDPNETILEVSSPVLSILSTKIQVLKSSDKTDIVQNGDTIKYILKATNTNGYALKDITVKDKLPQGTSYISGGTLNGDYVDFNIEEIKQGETIDLELVVKVDINKGVISNTAQFGLNECSTSIVDGVPMVNTNTVENTVETYGNLLIKKTVIGNGPSSDKFEFVINFSDGGSYDGIDNGSTITLSKDESKVIKDIPLTTTVKVIENDKQDYQPENKELSIDIKQGNNELVFKNTYTKKPLIPFINVVKDSPEYSVPNTSSDSKLYMFSVVLFIVSIFAIIKLRKK